MPTMPTNLLNDGQTPAVKSDKQVEKVNLQSAADVYCFCIYCFSILSCTPTKKTENDPSCSAAKRKSGASARSDLLKCFQASFAKLGKGRRFPICSGRPGQRWSQWPSEGHARARCSRLSRCPEASGLKILRGAIEKILRKRKTLRPRRKFQEKKPCAEVTIYDPKHLLCRKKKNLCRSGDVNFVQF